MNVIKTDVLDVYIIEPDVFGDKRGYFFESWSKKKMEEVFGNCEIVKRDKGYYLLHSVKR